MSDPRRTRGDGPEKGDDGGAGRRLAWGAFRELLGTAGARSLNLLRLVVLAKLFLPESYGAYSTGLLFLALVLLLTQAGFHPYVVKVKEKELDEAFSTALLLSLGVAGTGALAMALSAPLWATVLDDPELSTVLLILSLAALETPTALPRALLDRRLQFGRARILEAGGIVAGLVLTVLLFVAGVLPEYAMAWGHVGSQMTRNAAYWWAARPLPHFRATRRQAGLQLRYGVPVVLAGGSGFVSHRADDLAVRAFWGNAMLGLYSVAFYLPAALREVSVALERVSLSVMAREEGREQRGALFRQTTLIVAALTLPAGFGLAAFAEPLTLAILRAEWIEAAPLLRIFGVAFGLMACTGYTWGSLAYVADETKAYAWINAWSALAMLGLGVPMIWWAGPEGGAWFTLLLTVLIAPALYLPLIRRVVGDLSFLRTLAGPIAGTGLAAAVVYLLGGPELSPTAGLVAYVAFVLACGGTILWSSEALRGPWAMRKSAQSPISRES